MLRIMLWICIVVIVVAYLVLLYREPGLFLTIIVGMLGWAYFRWRILTDDEADLPPEGRPPKHRPRHKPTRLPSEND